jgi:hypothetical protein
LTDLLTFLNFLWTFISLFGVFRYAVM